MRLRLIKYNTKSNSSQAFSFIYLLFIWFLFDPYLCYLSYPCRSGNETPYLHRKKTLNISIEGLVPVSFEKLTGSQANRIAACYIIIAYLLLFSINSNINHIIILPIIIYITSKTIQILLFLHYARHPRTMHLHERIHQEY